MLYVLLWMRPDVLQRDLPLMRMLVDRHLSDTWCVTWAPGQHADLAVEWDGFKVGRLFFKLVLKVC